MVLQRKRQFCVVWFVFGHLAPDGGAENTLAVMYQNTVVQHRDVGGLEQFPGFGKRRRLEDDVV